MTPIAVFLSLHVAQDRANWIPLPRNRAAPGSDPSVRQPHRVWRSVLLRLSAVASREKHGTSLYACRTPQLTAAGGGGGGAWSSRAAADEADNAHEPTGWRSLNSAPNGSASPAAPASTI